MKRKPPSDDIIFIPAEDPFEDLPSKSPPPGVQIIKASYDLQKRVGKGPFDPVMIMKCQNIMDTAPVDFPEMAKPWLDSLKEAIDRADMDTLSMSDRIEFLSHPIMNLKSNGRMFKYGLVTDLTNIMLTFLEIVVELDTDVIEILRAHHQSLESIIERRIKGDGDHYGRAMRQELKEACGRYCRKHDLPPLMVSMS